MLSEEALNKALAPYYPKLRQCVVDGMDAYQNDYNNTRHIHQSPTRPMLVRDHILYAAQMSFADEPNVSFRRRRGLICIIIRTDLSQDVAIRIKKFNHKFLTSNIPTKQSDKFSRQLPLFTAPKNENQLDLFGYPLITEPLHLNIGYIPDHLWTEAQEVLLTCPKDRVSLYYSINLARELATAEAESTQQPPEPPQVIQLQVADIEPIRKRVKLKKSQKDNSNE